MIGSPKTKYSKSQQLLAVSLGALPGLFLLITSTTFLVEGQFVYDVKRMIQLCLMLILFVMAFSSPDIRAAFAHQSARIPTWLGMVLGLIVALGVTSSLVSAASSDTYMDRAINSLLEVALLTLLVVATLTIAACRVVAGKLFDQVAITLLAIAAIAVGIQEILGAIAALVNRLEFYSRISLMHYSWPRFYNQVQSWVLPVLGLIPFIWARSNSEMLQSRIFQALVCLSVLLLHWYIILMSGGRGVAISLLFTFVICLIFLPAIRGTTFRWHLPGLMLGVLLFTSIVQINNHIQTTETVSLPAASNDQVQSNSDESDSPKEKSNKGNRLTDQSISGRLSLDSSGRISLWQDAITHIKDKPLLGIGPMNYACMGPAYRAGHPHNFALQFAAEWGLPAMFGLIGVGLFLTFRMWELLRTGVGRYETQLASMLATGLTAAAVYSFLSGILVMPASQVMGLLIGGWLLGVMPVRQKRAGARKSILVMTSAMIISGLITAFSYSELAQREYRESSIALLDKGIPRYWQQGKQCKYFDQF